MDRLGKIVREAREKVGESPKDLAKRCKVTVGFARHIELTRFVRISPRVAGCLAYFYGIPRRKLDLAVKRRNEVGRAYYRAHRKKKAA